MISERVFQLFDRPFRQFDTGSYLVDYYDSGGPILVVTFENREYGPKPPDRPCWGSKFLIRQGVSILGVKVEMPDWYRKPDLRAFFDGPFFAEIAAKHQRILFYGSSMGGYGALAYATPGSEVLAFNPQTTLDHALVPWETRYPDGKKQDWSGPRSDAALNAVHAAKIYVAYDPLYPDDLRHVERLDMRNVVHLKLPLVEHVVAGHLLNLGLLEDVLKSFLQGHLEVSRWAQLVRKRRRYTHYYLTMAKRSAQPAVVAACMKQALLCKPFLQSNIKYIYDLAASYSMWGEAWSALKDAMDAHGVDVSGNEYAQKIQNQVTG